MSRKRDEIFADSSTNVAVQELAARPESVGAVITQLAHAVFADNRVKNPFALVRSRINHLKTSLLAAGVPSDQANTFYRESLEILENWRRTTAGDHFRVYRRNPAPVRKFEDINVVPRQNGARK